MTIYQASTKTVEEVEKLLKSSLTQGLSSDQAAQREQEYQAARIGPSYVSSWSLLYRQFRSPFIYLLVASSLISFFLGDYTNSVMILVILLLNALLSFFQEYRAEQALRILRGYIGTQNKVLRDGMLIFIKSTDIVPGDIVVLEAGDAIPADIRFIKAYNLMIDESSLTGESAPVAKTTQVLISTPKTPQDTSNSGFLGTTVTSGKGTGIVIAIGNQTSFGEISQLTTQTIRESGFHKNILRFSQFMLALVVITLLGVFIFNLVLKGPENIVNLLLFSVALAVSITPEALPVITTFSLTRGALLLARQQVIVKRLSAIEDMGSIDLLCTDKTGTLTENILKVADTYSYQQENPLFYAVLGTSVHAKQTSLDPFNTALWQALDQHDQQTAQQAAQAVLINILPFSSEILHTTVLVNYEQRYILVARGVYEKIMPMLSEISQQDQRSIDTWISNQERNGKRALVIAYKYVANPIIDLAHEEHDLKLAGMVSFEDPIKKTVSSALAKARTLGITIKILTGDSKDVATAIARQIGLITAEDQVITGEQFSKLSFDRKQKQIENVVIFARVSPQQKYEIVSMLKKNHVIGFLGDGINDAPALKAAQVGIAVHTAVALAQDAADIILLKKSLHVIVNGIETGRIVFANTVKYIKTTLSTNIGNFYSIALSSFFIPFLPLLPLQILLINLIADFPMIAISTDTTDRVDIVRPGSYNFQELLFTILLFAPVSSLYDFVFFGFFYHKDPAVLQTNWFIESCLTGIIVIFSLRTRYVCFKSQRPSVQLISLAILASALALVLPYTALGQRLFSFITPSAYDVALVIVIVLAYFITNEIIKLFYYYYRNSTQQKNHNQQRHARAP